MEKPELPHEHSTNIEAVLRRRPDPGHFQSVADSFQKLGDSSRLRILWLLCHCEECVYNSAATR